MSWTQVTTTRRYTKAERKAFRDRERRRRGQRRIWINGREIWCDRVEFARGTFNFADRLGVEIPTPRVNRDFL